MPLRAAPAPPYRLIEDGPTAPPPRWLSGRTVPASPCRAAVAASPTRRCRRAREGDHGEDHAEHGRTQPEEDDGHEGAQHERDHRDHGVQAQPLLSVLVLAGAPPVPGTGGSSRDVCSRSMGTTYPNGGAGKQDQAREQPLFVQAFPQAPGCLPAGGTRRTLTPSTRPSGSRSRTPAAPDRRPGRPHRSRGRHRRSSASPRNRRSPCPARGQEPDSAASAITRSPGDTRSSTCANSRLREPIVARSISPDIRTRHSNASRSTISTDRPVNILPPAF